MKGRAGGRSSQTRAKDTGEGRPGTGAAGLRARGASNTARAGERDTAPSWPSDEGLTGRVVAAVLQAGETLAEDVTDILAVLEKRDGAMQE